MDGGKNFDPQKGQLENSNGRINVPSCFFGCRNGAETGTQLFGIVAWFHFRIFSVIGQQRNSVARCWQDNLHCTDVDVAAAWSQHSCASSTWWKYCSGFWDPSEIRGGYNAPRLGNDGRLVLNIVPRALLAQTRNVMRRLGRHGLDAEFVRISVNCETTDSKFGSPSIKETFLPLHFYEKSQEK